MKTKSPKLSKEALIKIWQASRPNVYKNKKKYTRKSPINKIKSESPRDHGLRYKQKLRTDKIRKIKLGNK